MNSPISRNPVVFVRRSSRQRPSDPIRRAVSSAKPASFTFDIEGETPVGIERCGLESAGYREPSRQTGAWLRIHVFEAVTRDDESTIGQRHDNTHPSAHRDRRSQLGNRGVGLATGVENGEPKPEAIRQANNKPRLGSPDPKPGQPALLHTAGRGDRSNHNEAAQRRGRAGEFYRAFVGSRSSRSREASGATGNGPCSFNGQTWTVRDG